VTIESAHPTKPPGAAEREGRGAMGDHTNLAHRHHERVVRSAFGRYLGRYRRLPSLFDYISRRRPRTVAGQGYPQWARRLRQRYEVQRRTATGELRRMLFATEWEALSFAQMLVRRMACSAEGGYVRIVWPGQHAED
jgi:hypothetical protein